MSKNLEKMQLKSWK